jgi:putative transposase
MSDMMNKKKLQAMAEELAKDLKTPEDLSQLSAFLTKLLAYVYATIFKCR